MRVLLFVVLSTMLVMCKSKEVIPAEELVGFVVLIKEGSDPGDVKEDISYDLASSERVEDDTNQWSMQFRTGAENNNKVKTQLLNHPLVMSVFTAEQFAIMKRKRGARSQNGSIDGRRATKQ